VFKNEWPAVDRNRVKNEFFTRSKFESVQRS
jgi:hypothetical protein